MFEDIILRMTDSFLEQHKIIQWIIVLFIVYIFALGVFSFIKKLIFGLPKKIMIILIILFILLIIFYLFNSK